MRTPNFLSAPASVFLLLMISGCSLIIGNVKPLEEKSDAYGIMDLSKVNSDWVRLDPKVTQDTSTSAPPESGISDVVYQSTSSASIISINSACKTAPKGAGRDRLEDLSRELFLGISDIKQQETSKLVVDENPAFQTTLRGKLNQEEMMLRTIVLKHSTCIYDLMYISRPERFKDHEKDFTDFVNSLRLK
jgi:hypothetical protein